MSDKDKKFAPWMPENNFWEDNHPAINEIFQTLDRQSPGTSPPDISDEADAPSSQTREWMWRALMGKQHGTMEGQDGKISIPRTQEYYYWPNLSRIHYGDHYFTVPRDVDRDKHYTKGFVIAGIQDENVDRLMTLINKDSDSANIDEIVMMTGQRLRGEWRAPGEQSINDLFSVTQQYSNAKIDALRQTSPFVKAEEAKAGTHWHQPFATEYEMCRLAVEAVFQEQIDWKNYPVTIFYDDLANPQSYQSSESLLEVPAREEALVTYELRDGRRVYVLNAKAVPRPGRMPRPTSDSIAREASELIPFKQGEKLVIASSIPHTRAAIDALIRLTSLRRLSIETADLVTAKWLPWKELIAGLGEIPATYKADQRLRAVIAGEDPDSLALSSL